MPLTHSLPHLNIPYQSAAFATRAEPALLPKGFIWLPCILWAWTIIIEGLEKVCGKCISCKRKNMGFKISAPDKLIFNFIFPQIFWSTLGSQCKYTVTISNRVSSCSESPLSVSSSVFIFAILDSSCDLISDKLNNWKLS